MRFRALRPAELPSSRAARNCLAATGTRLSLFRSSGRCEFATRPAQKSQQASRRCSNGTLRLPVSPLRNRPHRARRAMWFLLSGASSAWCMKPVRAPGSVRPARRIGAAVAWTGFLILGARSCEAAGPMRSGL